MMKYLLTLFSAVLVFGLSGPCTVLAQCTPDPDVTAPGIHPQVLPEGNQDVPYPDTRLTVVLVVDTVYSFDTTIRVPQAPFPIPVDVDVPVTYRQYVFDSVGNLPEGMNIDLASCNNDGCVYPVEAGMPESNRACVQLTGTPTSSNIYRPTIFATAQGTLIVPDLGFPIPNLPAPGTELDLDSIPEQFAGLLGPIRQPVFRTRLRINPESLTDLCNPELDIVPGFLRPLDLPNGKVGEEYNNGQPVSMTLDLPRDTIVESPTGDQLPVRFTRFTIVGTDDVPQGMRYDLDTCTQAGNCSYEVNLIDSARNRICFNLIGNPTESGQFFPSILTQAQGTVTLFGTEFTFDNIPEQFRAAIAGVTEFEFSSRLRVEPEVFTQLCNEDVSVSSGVMQPQSVPPADSAEVYPPQNMTVDLPESGLLTIPNVPLPVFVNYSSFTFEETEDLPEGMNFSGYCPQGNCTIEYNAVDVGRNRVCFTLEGTPVEVGSFEPTLVALAVGEARFGNTSFPINNVPPFLPPQIAEALEELQTVRFSTQIDVEGSVSRDADLVRTHQIRLYPNPAEEEAHLSFTLERPASVEVRVHDLSGRTLYTRPAETCTPGTQTLTLPNLPAGFHLVQLRIGKRFETLRLRSW